MKLQPLAPTLAGIALLAVSFQLTGCYSPEGPTPEAPKSATIKDYDYADVANVVTQSTVTLAAPISEASTGKDPIPEQCQSLTFNRFSLKDKTDRAYSDADAVYLLMPGMLAGANAITYLAEELVYESHLKHAMDVDVVVMERRNQCLNDLTGLNEAERLKDVQVAVDYYYHNATVNGKTFAGFYKPGDVDFIIDFGLPRILEDMNTVAQYLIPDQETRKKKLFIGGHSLGGNITSAYMGWDFDGDPTTTDDAGFNQAAGFIRLDISVTPKDPALDPFLAYGATNAPLDLDDEANKAYRKGIQSMKLGLTPRFVRFPGVNGESLSLLEMVAMQASWYPDEENTLVHEVPLGGTPKTLLRLIHSQNINGFVKNNPSFFDFRYTNEALLGLILDDDYMPITILQTSLGFLAGGPVVKKTFPNSPVITNLAGVIDEFLAAMLTKETLYIAKDAGPSLDELGTGPLYRWANFDEIGNAQDPQYQSSDGSLTYTTTQDEVTDIADLARAIFQGDSSFTEWYMPARLSHDMQQLAQPSLIEGLPFFHASKRRQVPLLEIVGTQSIPDVTVDPLAELVIAEGYNHLDVLFAANNRSSHQQSKVIAPMIDFAKSNLQN